MTKFLSNCTICKKLSRTVTHNTDDYDSGARFEDIYSNKNVQDGVPNVNERVATEEYFPPRHRMDKSPAPVDDIKQKATDCMSTYLKLTRTLGLTDEDALSGNYHKVSGI